MNWKDSHTSETGASIALSALGVQSMASPAKRKATAETGEESRSKKAKDEDAQVQDIDNDKPSPKDGVSSPKELKNALYARCASEDDGKVFFQSDLLSYNIIPDNNVEKLLLYTQQLLNEGLFKLMTKDGKTCWRVVRRDDAAKYRSCFLDPNIDTNRLLGTKALPPRRLWSIPTSSRLGATAYGARYFEREPISTWRR